MALEMSEAEFSGLMAGGTATVAAGAIVIDTSGVTAARQVMEQEAQQMGAAMIGAGEDTGSAVAEIGSQAVKATSSVKTLRMEAVAMRTAGMLLGRLGLPGGAEIRTISTFTRMGAIFQGLTPLIDNFATSLEKMPNTFGTLATLGSLVGGSIGAIVAAAAPVAIAVGAAVVVIKSFEDASKKFSTSLDESIAKTEAYYKAIQTGTTETLTKELKAAQDRKAIADGTIDALQKQADKEKAYNDGLTAGGSVLDRLRDGTFSWTETNKETTAALEKAKKESKDAQAAIDGLTEAIKSDKVAANDAKAAAVEANKTVIGMLKDESDQKVKLAQDDRTMTVKQVQDRLAAINDEKNANNERLAALFKLDQNDQDVINSENELFAAGAKLQEEQDHLTQSTLALARAREAEDATQKQVKAYGKYLDKVDEINAATTDKITAEDKTYATDRIKLIQANAKSIRTLEANEKKQELDDQKKFQQQMADEVDREAQQRQQAADEIAQVSSEANTKLIQLQQDYQEKRQQMEEEHRNTLLEAAQRLDAKAIFNEMLSYGNKTRQQDRQLTTEEQRTRDEAAKRIQGINERLAAQQQEDAKKLAKMRQQFAEEEAAKQADFAEQKAALQEQGKEQLDQLDSQHQEKLAQIKSEGAKELVAEQNRFIQEFNQLGEHNGRMINIQQRGLNDLEVGLQNWFANINSQLSNQMARSVAVNQAVVTPYTAPATSTATVAPASTSGGTNFISTIASVGSSLFSGIGSLFGFQEGTGGQGLPHTGVFYGHAGEIVLNPDTSQAVRRAMGTGVMQSQLASAFAGGSQPSAISVPVTINGSGKTAQQIAQMASNQAYDRILTELERGYA